MSSITVKSQDLSEGDVLLLPFNKTATVSKVVVPSGPNAKFVQLWTEHGKTRVELGREVQVELRTL